MLIIKSMKMESKRKANGKQNESKVETNVNENVNVNENANVNVNVNDNASDSCVDGLQKVIDFYNNNIGALTPYGLQVLQSYLNDVDYEVIIFAMQRAVEANKRTIQYIKGTLNNWVNSGVKTLIEAQEESRAFKNKNTPKEETEEEKNARKVKELEALINGNK